MYAGAHRHEWQTDSRGGIVGGRVASIAILVLLAGGAVAGPIDPASAHGSTFAPTAATGSIAVAATGSYGYQPATFAQVPTNATITVTFTDDSNLAHTFTIIGKEGWVVPSNYTWEQIDNLGYGDSPPALFNANVTGIGDVSTSTFLSPGPGWYEFLCTVQGHFQNGMYGFIAFGENLPSNLTTPTSRTSLGGVTITPIQAASVGVFLLAFAIVYMVWRRRRLARRMPPSPVGPPKSVSTEAPGIGIHRGKGSG